VDEVSLNFLRREPACKHCYIGFAFDRNADKYCEVAMGFRIEIDENSERLLKKLRSDPAAVFEDAFTGYLLFLVGGSDEEILRWLADNIIALDSLTGSDLAFAIFAQRFTFRVHVPYSNAPRDVQLEDIEVDLSDIEAANTLRGRDVETVGNAITALVTSGRLGWVLDGTEITAITYGVDRTARAFNVLGDVPCLLVLDPLAATEFEVFHLTPDNTAIMIPLLRTTISRLINAPDYIDFAAKLKDFRYLYDHLQGVKGRLGQLEAHLSALPNEFNAHKAERSLSDVRAALMAANLYRLRAVMDKRIVRSFMSSKQVEGILEAVGSYHSLLETYSRTVQQIALYSTYDWPLQEPKRSRYLDVYNKYVRRLAKDVPEEPDFDDVIACIELKKRLIADQQDLVDSLMRMLPGKSDLESAATEIARAEIQDLIETAQSLEAQVHQIMTALNSMKQVSLTAHFRNEVQRRHLSSIRRYITDSAATLVGTWLRELIQMYGPK
jgi:hypothetical protein